MVYHFILSGQTFSIIVPTGRVVRHARAELSATGRAVHGPSCPRAELSGYRQRYISNGEYKDWIIQSLNLYTFIDIGQTAK